MGHAARLALFLLASFAVLRFFHSEFRTEGMSFFYAVLLLLAIPGCVSLVLRAIADLKRAASPA
jgi:hypothetical protein